MLLNSSHSNNKNSFTLKAPQVKPEVLMFFYLSVLFFEKPVIHFPIEKVTNHKYQRPQNNSNNAHKQGCYIIIPAIIIRQKK